MRTTRTEADTFPSQQGPLDPNDIAPFVCYLASDMAANVNGQTFLVYGGNVTLLSLPRRVRTIFKNGPVDAGRADGDGPREHHPRTSESLASAASKTVGVNSLSPNLSSRENSFRRET